MSIFWPFYVPFSVPIAQTPPHPNNPATRFVPDLSLATIDARQRFLHEDIVVLWRLYNTHHPEACSAWRDMMNASLQRSISSSSSSITSSDTSTGSTLNTGTSTDTSSSASKDTSTKKKKRKDEVQQRERQWAHEAINDLLHLLFDSPST